MATNSNDFSITRISNCLQGHSSGVRNATLCCEDEEVEEDEDEDDDDEDDDNDDDDDDDDASTLISAVLP